MKPVQAVMTAAFAAAAALLASPSQAADPALIAAAKKEGRVSWYTTLIVNQFARPAAEAFEKKYGVKVDYVRADPNAIALRVTAEAKAGRVQADIFDGFGYPALANAGLIERWVPESARRLPKEFVDPQGAWVATNLYVLTPAYNTQLVPKGQEPKTFEDLLDPKWRGRIAWSSRASASSAPGFIGIVLAKMGEEKGHAYLKRLAQQNVAGVDGSARQVLDQVIAGEYAIALQTFNHHSVISAKQGAPSQWIAMEPASVALSVFSLAAGGPHPNAGKLLLDFMVSEEGQKLFRAADYMPVDPAVPPVDPALRPDTGKFEARTFTPEELDASMPKWMDIHRTYFR